MKKYFVYILLCADSSYYVGITSDLDERMMQHSTGMNFTCYTNSRRPVQLVWYEEFEYVDLAIKREKQIKNWTRSKKEALIKNDFNKLRELSTCKNSTKHSEYSVKKNEN